MKPRRRWPLIAATLIGVLLGAGVFTFDYAEGTSYLSTDPKACANCHIMNSQYDSWQKSSHHTVATCVDCHLPHDFLGKYLAKGENGWNHSKAFTLQDFKEPIRLTPKNSQILQNNCLHCHADLVHGLAQREGGSEVGSAPDCVRCHPDVGHGEPLGLGGPWRGADEQEIETR